MLKGLGLVAVTDHNTARNLPAAQKVADDCGLVLLPGLEITTAEEVHLLAYFPTVEAAVEMGDLIYDSLPPVRNKPEFFGEQLIMDEEDNVIGTLDKLLINACPFSIADLTRMIRKRNGVPVPAHINRTSNSLLANLGYIPAEENFTTLEVYAPLPLDDFVDVSDRLVVHSSDAHDLLSIHEQEFSLDCPHDVEKVLELFREGRPMNIA